MVWLGLPPYPYGSSTLVWQDLYFLQCEKDFFGCSIYFRSRLDYLCNSSHFVCVHLRARYLRFGSRRNLIGSVDLGHRTGSTCKETALHVDHYEQLWFCSSSRSGPWWCLHGLEETDVEILLLSQPTLVFPFIISTCEMRLTSYSLWRSDADNQWHTP